MEEEHDNFKVARSGRIHGREIKIAAYSLHGSLLWLQGPIVLNSKRIGVSRHSKILRDGTETSCS